jgi:putative dehydrogenase
MLDAPISGTPVVAAAGKASLFVSGEESVYQRVRPVLDFATSVPLVGRFGTGSKLKYIANLLIGIHIAAAAEAIALAERAGVDPELAIETISGSVAASEMFRHRAPRMVQRDFAAPMNDVDAFLKDVDLIQEFARTAGVDAALFQAAGKLYQRAADHGLGDQELSSIVTLLADEPER